MFEQERTIVRLQQRVLQDAAIAVCFLAGSFGRRKQDGFSDLDVALVFATDAERAFAWEKRREFVASVLPYVPVKSFDGDHIRPFFHIALYSNGSKVDYRYESQESLEPNAWDSDLHFLKDRAGWGEQYQSACGRAALWQPRLTSADLKALDDRFWVMFWDTFRLLLRGDWQKPFTIYLEMLHFTLPPLLQVLPPEDPAHQALLQAQYKKDTRVTAKGLSTLLQAYLTARAAIVKRFDLAFEEPRGFETTVVQMVQRRVG